ncbi:MAG: saccharopine dehydrogenase family protein, partial [Nevskiales bacterium]
ASTAGVVLCPGVGFDVIPSDCLAATLKQALPDATHLALGFDTRTGPSAGTAKTAIEALAEGGRVRRDGKIVAVPLAWKSRRIDFGDGEKNAVTIPWGDVSTAYHSTGIPNIEVYIPASPRAAAGMKRMNALRWLLALPPTQWAMKRGTRAIRGPSAEKRAKLPTFLWGEVRNAAGTVRVGRIRVPNTYDITITGSLTVVDHLLGAKPAPGAYTPSRLLGADLVTRLPDCGPIQITG